MGYSTSKIFIIFSTLFFICGCSYRITEKKEKGLHEVAKFFDGDCTYSVFQSISIGGDNGKLLMLEISNSKLIEQYQDKAEMCASCAAAIFFTDLEDEKKDIDKLQVKLKFKDGDSSMFTYRGSTLDTLLMAMPFVDTVVHYLVNKDYNRIRAILSQDTIMRTVNEDTLINKSKNLDSIAGEVKGFIPMGFWIRRFKGTEVLHISGILSRSNENTQFSVEVEPENNERFIYLNYIF